MALITVIGASGRQGMAQIRQALEAGYKVRAISRKADPFAGAKIEGIEDIEVRPMDLYDTATFKPALEGSDYIFYTHPLQARADKLGLQIMQERASEIGAAFDLISSIGAGTQIHLVWKHEQGSL